MRATVRNRKAGDFAPLFDWHDPLTLPLDDSQAVELLRSACIEYVKQGGTLVTHHFGVETIERKRDYRGAISGTYKTGKHSDPIGALLDGKPSTSYVLIDAARLLRVDEFWLTGFLHGFDFISEALKGKRADGFSKSLSYQKGLEAGLRLADEFKPSAKKWKVRTELDEMMDEIYMSRRNRFPTAFTGEFA